MCILCGAALAASLPLANATASDSFPFPDDDDISGSFKIYPSGRKECLDLWHGNTTGNKVVTYPCNGTTSQRWAFPVGDAGPVFFNYSPWCPDVKHGGVSTGAPVQIWVCNGIGAQQ
ncbi:RICIN domain-containing protein [Streptomyces sp. NPDC055709]